MEALKSDLSKTLAGFETRMAGREASYLVSARKPRVFPVTGPDPADSGFTGPWPGPSGRHPGLRRDGRWREHMVNIRAFTGPRTRRSGPRSGGTFHGPVHRWTPRSGGGGEPEALPRRRHQAEAVDVSGQHRQRHGPGETLLSVAPHPVEATVLQVAGGRPAGGVGAPRLAERLPAFPDAVRLRQPAFPRHGVQFQHPGRPEPVRGAVQTPVEAHPREIREPARASPPMGTATSTSLPSHMTERCGRNP